MAFSPSDVFVVCRYPPGVGIGAEDCAARLADFTQAPAWSLPDGVVVTQGSRLRAWVAIRIVEPVFADLHFGASTAGMGALGREAPVDRQQADKDALWVGTAVLRWIAMGNVIRAGNDTISALPDGRIRMGDMVSSERVVEAEDDQVLEAIFDLVLQPHSSRAAEG